MIQTLTLLFFILFHQTHSKPDYLKLNLRYTGNHHSLSQTRIQDSIRLSFLSSRTTLSAPIISGASTGSGQYLVEFHLGTPPQPLHLIVDTGSDLIWSRCSPCRSNCSIHHPPGTTFLPRHSTTFSPFHCYSPSCHLIPHPSHFCNHTRLHSPCRYHYAYADSSSTSGFFSHDVATLHTLSGHPIHIPNLPFGCAFNISPGPALSSAHGVLGLGRGPISFLSHTSSNLGNLFSYCLLDYTLSPPPTSFLLIGHHSIKPSFTSNLSFTPLLSNPLSPTFYYIHITTVYLNNIPLPIDPDVWALDPNTGNGGTIIDSGTTLSFLPTPAYDQIVSTMALKIPDRFKISHGPPGFDLCVNSTKPLRKPKLVFKLLGGAVLAPPPGNYFIEAADGVTCLALQPADAGFGVIGNLMQQGFLFVFDRDASRLGFSRNGCAV
ncbi:Aspartic peptidase A1 family protein [Dioscorea alata]|uniref:Aspartic peptidase A1 family protein n=1 Tax=Dioscorea alata TaxID=55571 RepID=A0ACB7U6H1_DIOAL|nr:Aspartic peptidase A1 family protein [Dioscorea alata]